ncbi:5-methyltetrahydropteroyltriglutamate--homocysteine S-methyltransferase [Actinomadura barringtoniae]|uniref:5-methyltetrahydropteroyltriglutamate--homocysteine S-methyltransferase n=1 Tax=Actinomadura barringtoniae TaxID=1427535 RepID=A0A939TAZ3_9ACTN|nr:5-methyltetrahydropteroyltriglutamate--homocysteine S-methyltransferase [Actinomadura barringtoniae]MBO2453007.1 5-methyltetrahydropteroyltriglutamate--homocysteine S-methyltransferase [Actinomadura barringtoniae]
MTAALPTDFPAATVLGYPRIGPRRELKRALESYWNGTTTRDDLLSTGRRLREATWRRLAGLGIAVPPSNTFSYYDHVLDTAFMLDAVPDRHRAAETGAGAGAGVGDGDGLDVYFAMARGTGTIAPLRMTKWFDTNYHYIVPEIGPETAFRLADEKPILEAVEARTLGIATRPVLLGPVTFLLLSEAAPGSPEGFTPLERLNDVLDVYAQILESLAAEGVDWVQLDEPALVADRTPVELAAVRVAYERLCGLPDRPRIFVSSYFGELGEALPVLATTPIDAIGLDLVSGGLPADLSALRGKTVVAGVVPGRNIWRTHLDDALNTLRHLRHHVGTVSVSTSCSLLHVPYDLDQETELDPAVRERLAFADQKAVEVQTLANLLAQAPAGDMPAPPARPTAPAPEARWDDRSPYAARAAAQAEHLRLPPLPITTIGSFPQTGDLRAARAALVAGEIGEEQYETQVKAEIERSIRLQEKLGLDVLVHGEPERNDMVQYFAEHLDGFAVSRHGWVQSYGSRCTRPPILHGDVSRPAPITARWTRYAQSLTSKPVKGMLTGPVTIVAWSFVREDLPLPEVVGQVADAIRGEVADLQDAGSTIIQVDEPALRELLPLRSADQAAYLSWAVAAYRHATSVAADRTQIHTHLCYSNAAQVLEAIDGLDADVTTIESARSGGRILPAVASFSRGLGPGVYDIHSPRVPSADEVTGLIEAILAVLPVDRAWINPDCGLKTRTYEQVEASLANVVAARDRMLVLTQAP